MRETVFLVSLGPRRHYHWSRCAYILSPLTLYIPPPHHLCSNPFHNIQSGIGNYSKDLPSSTLSSKLWMGRAELTPTTVLCIAWVTYLPDSFNHKKKRHDLICCYAAHTTSNSSIRFNWFHSTLHYQRSRSTYPIHTYATPHLDPTEQEKLN